jgi:hypothetical protein
MNPPSFDIKDILEAYGDSSGLIDTVASEIFVGREPTTPNDCITIFDTPGYPPQLTMDVQQYEYPSVQIRVRNTNYVDGWNLINVIKDSLHGRAKETWNGTLYSVIYCSSGPALLDWDENGRARFFINLNIQRR